MDRRLQLSQLSQRDEDRSNDELSRRSGLFDGAFGEELRQASVADRIFRMTMILLVSIVGMNVMMMQLRVQFGQQCQQPG